MKKSIIKDNIKFGSKTIDFQLKFTDRKTLGITVTPEMEVMVNAPMDSPLSKIKEKIHKRAPWIIKQQSFFLTFHPKTPARKFVSGETHFYLGRQYQLQVKNEKLKTKSGEGVKLQGRYLNVYTHDKSKVQKLVNEWYRQKAEERLPQIAEPLFNKFIAKHNLSSFTFNFSLKAMKLRWGSCSIKGKIILNPKLIKAPRGCIEYVIIHELCHLIHHNHNQKFIDLQASEMPDWEKWKKKLELMLA